MNKLNTILIIFFTIVIAIVSFQLGQITMQDKIEKRALKIGEKGYYNSEDIEIIIFSEDQL